MTQLFIIITQLEALIGYILPKSPNIILSGAQFIIRTYYIIYLVIVYLSIVI